MSLIGALDVLSPGELARHPGSLAWQAYFDGWNQAIGRSPTTFPRFLNAAEEREWRLGWADARKAPPPGDKLTTPESPPVQVDEPAPVEDPPPVLSLVAMDNGLTYPPVDGSQPCAQTDPEAWFPGRGGSPRQAKQMCLRCDFREQCLEYALAASYAGYPLLGVWGGTTDRERRAIRRQRQTQAAA